MIGIVQFRICCQIWWTSQLIWIIMNLGFSFYEKADFQSHRTNNRKMSVLCKGIQTGATITIICFWNFRSEIVRPILECIFTLELDQFSKYICSKSDFKAIIIQNFLNMLKIWFELMKVTQWKNGFIKRPHNTANLNFSSPKLRVRLLVCGRRQLAQFLAAKHWLSWLSFTEN